MGSFLDHYNAEIAKLQGAPSKSPSSAVSLSSLPGPKSAADQVGEQFLGAGKWLLDMLDRPRNAVANVLYKGIENNHTVADAVLKDGPSGLLAGNPLGASAALWEGLTSNKPSDKHSFSDILEKVTDSVGSYDPNYVDEKDNVNPIVKGVGGFIGDVALDPLTYIPATWGPKLAKMGFGAVDKGIKAVSEGAFGAPVLTDAAKAAVAAADGERAAAKMVTEVSDATPKAPHVDFSGDDMAEAMLHSTPDVPVVKGLSATADAQRGESAFGKFLETTPDKKALVGEKFAPAVAETIKPSVLEGLLSKAPEIKDSPIKFPGGAGKLTESEAVQSAVLNAGARSPIQEFLASLSKASEGIPGAEVPATLNEWVRTIPDTQKIPGATAVSPQKSMAEVRQLQVQYAQAMKNAAAGDQQAKAVAQRIGQQVKPYVESLRKEHAKAAAIVKKPDTTFSAYQAMVAHDYTRVENALGRELSDFLSRNHTPEKFDHLVKAIKAVTDAGPDTADVLRTTDRNLSNVLSDRLGVPRLQKPSSAEEVTQRIDDLFAAADDYQKAVSDTVLDVLRKQADEGGFPFKIDKDGKVVLRTTLRKGEGFGKYADQFNTFVQYSIKARLSDKVANQVDRASRLISQGKGSKGAGYLAAQGKSRTMQYKEGLLRALDDVDANLDALGLSVVIGHGGGNTSMLRLSELYKAIEVAAEERGTQVMADLALYNGGSAVPDVLLMEAVNDAVHGASREQVRATLLLQKKIGPKGDVLSEVLPNNLANVKGTWPYVNEKAAEGAAFGNPVGKTRGGAYMVQYGDSLVDNLTDLIMDAAPMLKIRASENLAAYTAKSAAETHTLATQAVKQIDAALASPSVVATTKALGGVDRAVAEEAVKIAATPDAMAAAQRLAGASMDRATQVDIRALQKALPAAEKATTVKEMGEVAEGNVTTIEREVADTLKKEGEYRQPGESPDPDFVTAKDTSAMNADLGDAFDEAGQSASQAISKRSPKTNLSDNPEPYVDALGYRIQDPYGKLKWKAKSWFDQNFQAGQVHPIFARFQNSLAMRANYISEQLKAIHHTAKKAGDAEGNLVAGAFQNVQRGIESTSPVQAQIEKMLQGVVGDFFDLEASGAMANSFFRIGKVDAVNAMLAQKGLNPEKYAFDVAKASTGKGVDFNALADQWKAWDVTDPLDFIHRMNLAREELAINAGVARNFLHLAEETGALSSTPKAGFVEIVATGKSRFGVHIPEGTYVKRELAQELQQVESVLRTSRRFEGELGHFIDTVYAPVLNGWKRSITINRPGHHVRNYIGSTSATWVRRGFNEFRRSHVDAYKVLASRGNYKDVDMLAAAEYNSIKDLPQGGDVLLSLGKRGDLTVDEAYAFMANSGMLPSFRVHEDFLASEGNLSKVMSALSLTDTKYGKVAGSVSEYVDHLTRTQHFMQALRQDAKRFPNRSKARLMQDAVDESLKYHPDATMLTPFESKLRYAIPFYTWFAKMMPALVESLMMHPGRVSMPVKASYNMAVAMGLDPASITDPFPQDTLFPSFIKSNPLGPQLSMFGSYLRVNPGFAHLDVLNTFGDDPFRGLLGMTSPLLRVPVELATGGSMSTGGRIADSSDYLDQSIPGINYVSNITGFSPTGSVGTLLSGQGLDPQKGFVQKKNGETNKTGLDQGISAFNWLSGLGVQNLSRPNYVNYAEIEQRNQSGAKNAK